MHYNSLFLLLIVIFYPSASSSISFHCQVSINSNPLCLLYCFILFYCMFVQINVLCLLLCFYCILLGYRSRLAQAGGQLVMKLSGRVCGELSVNSVCHISAGRRHIPLWKHAVFESGNASFSEGPLPQPTDGHPSSQAWLQGTDQG